MNEAIPDDTPNNDNLDDDATGDLMNDSRNESAPGSAPETPSDPDLDAKVKAILGQALAAVPAAPTLDQIAARISRVTVEERVPTSTRPSPGGVVIADGADAADGDDGVHVVSLQPTPAQASATRAWPRIVLAAAAVIAVVALGFAVVNRPDDSETTVADDTTSPGLTVDEPVGVVPSTPPEGQVLTAISAVEGSDGRGTSLRYHRYAGRRSIEISALPAPPDAKTPALPGGSVERWGEREVAVSEDSTEVMFVAPEGLLVIVTGEPADIAEVLPTLEIVDLAGWNAFIDDVSSEIEALPVAGVYEIVDNDRAQGVLALEEVRTLDKVSMAVHIDPDSTALGVVPAGGTDNTTGVVAGTCLTVDDTTACRPTNPMGEGIPTDHVDTSYDVIIDDVWWSFGWSTTEVTNVKAQAKTTWPDPQALTPEEADDRSTLVEGVSVRWANEGAGQDKPLTWYVAALFDDAKVLTVELEAETGPYGFETARPFR